jgi:hypothetical protein
VLVLVRLVFWVSYTCMLLDLSYCLIFMHAMCSFFPGELCDWVRSVLIILWTGREGVLSVW